MGHNHIIIGDTYSLVIVSNPLTLHHEKLGARLDTASTPLDYGNPIEEYWMLKKGAGLADISNSGRLIITGKDRIPFLNSLLTNDLSHLAEGAGQHSALLNTKARVLADLYLFNQTKDVFVDTGYSESSKIKQALDNFVITEDAQIRDASKELIQVTVQGPKSAQVVKETLGTSVDDLKPLQQRTLGPSTIISRDRTGLGGYDLVMPVDEAEAVWQGFLLRSADLGTGPVGANAMETLRLEAGFPRYGIDFDESTIILEAGFKDAMSFTKGCYLGQEVVARATHIGRVNKQLVRMEVETKDALEARSRMVRDGAEAGFITSSSYSPGLGKTVAIGYANRDFAREGTRLMIEDHQKQVPALVTKIL